MYSAELHIYQAGSVTQVDGHNTRKKSRTLFEKNHKKSQENHNNHTKITKITEKLQKKSQKNPQNHKSFTVSFEIPRISYTILWVICPSAQAMWKEPGSLSFSCHFHPCVALITLFNLCSGRSVCKPRRLSPLCWIRHWSCSWMLIRDLECDAWDVPFGWHIWYSCR